MELLPGCRQQIGAVTLMGELHYIQKTCTSINITHIFSLLLVAFPAALTSSKAMREDWVGGAAVWLTAAEVPSHERVDANVEMLRLMARDDNRYNRCSDGASAAGGGVGRG